MSIKCGHCKGRHDSVAETRQCATGRAAVVVAPELDLKTPEFIRLIQESERDEDARVAAFKAEQWDNGGAVAVAVRPETRVEEYRRQQASTAAGNAAAERVARGGWGPSSAPARPAETAKVADGRYAVVEDGVLKFFKLTNGRKPGYVFLDIQASDDWHSIRNVTRIKTIVALIAQDARAAMIRYGQELGKCGHCGRTLTDEESRAAGIGPICAGKMV